MRILAIAALVALVLVTALFFVPTEECKAPPAGIDRFNHTWTEFECNERGCSGHDLYVPDFCPDPTCEDCDVPMTEGTSGQAWSSVPTGAKHLWLVELTK